MALLFYLEDVEGTYYVCLLVLFLLDHARPFGTPDLKA